MAGRLARLLCHRPAGRRCGRGGSKRGCAVRGGFGRRRFRNRHDDSGQYQDEDDVDDGGDSAATMEECELSLLSGRFVEHQQQQDEEVETDDEDGDQENDDEEVDEAGAADAGRVSGGGGVGTEPGRGQPKKGGKLRNVLRRLWKGFKRTFTKPGALDTGVDWMRGMEWIGALPTSFMMAGSSSFRGTQ